MPVYKARGVVTLGGNDVGNAKDLRITHETEEIFRKAFGTPYTKGGITHIAQRINTVIIELTLYDYQSTNLNAAIRGTSGSGLEATPATQALSFAGFNALDNCDAVSLSVPRFWIIPTAEVPIITETFGEIQLRGHAIYQASASPEWYTLTVA